MPEKVDEVFASDLCGDEIPYIFDKIPYMLNL